ncbi:GH32 C-terminal domain-containing protein [Actinomadura keratinilytica]|jgi:beta-fructofuranosidase|uniref:Glycosyl hydrolase family 32 C-terminal domain-containing protein n=1 Tax=Actinomadura keratinilytica TaxID=547461 RepID=A0ABP7ZDG2_9ACTN
MPPAQAAPPRKARPAAISGAGLRVFGRLLKRADGGRLDQGPDFYAPAVLQDSAAGRVLLWGWSWEARPQEDTDRAGWSGVLTAPRVTGVRPDGRLSMTPAPELERLRAQVPFTADGRLPVALPDAYELLITATGPAAVGLLRSADGRRVALVLDPAAGTVMLDRAGRPRTRGSRPSILRADVAPDRPLAVRLLVDGSLFELFADGGAATERIYRRPGDVPELTVAGAAHVTGWEPALPKHG